MLNQLEYYTLNVKQARVILSLSGTICSYECYCKAIWHYICYVELPNTNHQIAEFLIVIKYNITNKKHLYIALVYTQTYRWSKHNCSTSPVSKLIASYYAADLDLLKTINNSVTISGYSTLLKSYWNHQHTLPSYDC